MNGQVTIYALCDEAGAVHYVGQTRDVARRREEHAQVWPQWTMTALQEVSADEANSTEQRLIAAHEASGCQLANWVHTERARARMREVAHQRRGPARTDEVALTLRLPAELYARVKRAAMRESRSVHGQVLWYVRQGLAARATAPAPAPAAPPEEQA